MVFSRNYILRKGSTFAYSVALADIYVDLDPLSIYTIEGGLSSVSDSTERYPLSGVLSEGNTILTFSMSSEETSSIINLGEYDYALDIIVGGVVQTILEGYIIVKDDVSKLVVEEITEETTEETP